MNVGQLMGRVNRALHGVALHSLSSQSDYPFHQIQRVYHLPMWAQALVRDLGPLFFSFLNAFHDESRFGSFPGAFGAMDSCIRLWDWVPSSGSVVIGSDDCQAGHSADEAALRILDAVKRGYRLFALEGQPYNRRFGGQSRFTYDLSGESAYVDYLKSVYQRLRWRNHSAQLLLSVDLSDPPGQYYWLDMLSRAAGSFDGIAVRHLQTGKSSRNAYQEMSFEDWVLAENIRRMWQLEQLHQAANGAPIHVLAHGSSSVGAPSAPVRDGNIWAVVSAAIRLMYYHDTQFVGSACGYQLFQPQPTSGNESGKFLYVQPEQEGTTGFLYWLWYYMYRYLGDYYLPVSGSAPVIQATDSDGQSRTGLATPLIATVSWDYRDVYVIVANASWSSDYNAEISFPGFLPSVSSSRMIRHSDPSSAGVLVGSPWNALVHPLHVVASGFGSVSFVLQARSVCFVKVRLSPI